MAVMSAIAATGAYIAANAATIATVAVAAGSAYSAYAQNQAQEEMADYNKEVAQNQATQEKWNAEAAQKQAENEAIAAQQDARKQEEMERERHMRLKATNRARGGTSGVTGEGTPLLMAIETAQNMELDALETRRQGEINSQNIRYQGQQNFEGHMTNSRSSTAQAGSYGMQAKNAKTAKYTKSILAGAKGVGNYIETRPKLKKA